MKVPSFSNFYTFNAFSNLFVQAPVKFDSALIGSDSYAAMHDFKAVRNFLPVQKVHHSLHMMSEANVSSPLTNTLDPELF